MSKQSNQTILLDILRRNFLTTEEQVDGVDLANAGEIGFAINLFADIQDSNDFDFKEKFAQILPESAYIPSFIYKHVTRHGMVDYFAKASTTTIYLEFSIKAFKKKAIKDTTDSYKLVFPKSLKINIDQYTFTLFHPLVISVYERTNGDIVSAKYDLLSKNEISHIRTEPLSIFRVNDDKMMIALDVGQYRTETYKELIRVVDLGSQTEYRYDAIDDIAGFDVRIKTASGNISTLQKHSSQTTVSSTDASPFIYWSYDGSVISLMFSSEYYHYRPDIGDTLIVDVYHTDGKDGNFKYYGSDFQLVYPTSEQDSYTQRLQQVKFDISMETNVAAGGENEKTVEELKQYAVSINTNKGLVNSQPELEAYFANKGIKVKEIRSDQAAIIYRGDMVIGQSDNKIIPTRNVNITFDPETTQPFSTKTIRQGSCISSITDDPFNENNTYKVNNDITDKFIDWKNNLSDIYDLDDQGQLMSLPFTTTIFGNGPGVSITSFYKNENVRLNTDLISQTSIHQTPMTFLNISRDPLRDNGWLIDIPVIMDTMTYEKYSNDSTSIKLVIVIKNNEGESIYVLATNTTYVDSEFPNVIHFTKKLMNDETIDISGSLKLDITGDDVVQVSTGYTISDTHIFIPNELSFEVLGFVKGGAIPDDANVHQLVQANTLTVLTDGFEQVCSYKSDNFSLIRDYTNMFRPYIEPMIPADDYHRYTKDIPKRYQSDIYSNQVNESGDIVSVLEHRSGEVVTTEGGDIIYLHRTGEYDFNRPKPKSITYKIEDLPVVRSSFLLDRERATIFYNSISETKTILESDDFIRASNMTIMMRCMNCFGSSSEYYAYSGTDKQRLDRNDIKIAFGAKFKTNITSSQVTMTLALMKEDITNSISNTNVGGALKMNEVISTLTENYSNELDKLDFFGINNLGSDFQSIEKISDNTKLTGAGDFIKVREELNKAKFMNGVIEFTNDIDITILNLEG